MGMLLEHACTCVHNCMTVCCVCACMHACVHGCMHVCMYISVRIYSVFISLCALPCMRTPVHLHTCVVQGVCMHAFVWIPLE